MVGGFPTCTAYMYNVIQTSLDLSVELIAIDCVLALYGNVRNFFPLKLQLCVVQHNNYVLQYTCDGHHST